MKVLKFGGTSVGTPQSLQCVKAIVENQSEPCLVVVSALGGITNRLIEMANIAAEGSDDYLAVADYVRSRHDDVIRAMVAPELQPSVTEKVYALLDELLTICKAVSLLRELTPRSLDLVESYGERMSVIIVHAMFDSAVMLDSLQIIRTCRRFDRSVLDTEATSQAIAQAMKSVAPDAPLMIMGGFIARDTAGHISNLGRGGSDYTAAIMAAELGARVLEIWTDVDGFMTADPRVVKDAKVIDRLSFVEAMELCNFGAKVVYPPTIYPVFHANIPILIKNTFNATAAGTLIADGSGANNIDGVRDAIVGVTAIAQTCLLTLEGATAEFADRMINSLTRNGIEAFMPDGLCHCGILKSDAPRALEILTDKFAAEIAAGQIKGIDLTDNLSTLAIVVAKHVDDMTEAPRMLAEALNLHGIPVAYAPRRASAGTIACMVPDQFLSQALNAIHSSFINQNI